eukprot:698585-Amphidinium_carterae.1
MTSVTAVFGMNKLGDEQPFFLGVTSETCCTVHFPPTPPPKGNFPFDRNSMRRQIYEPIAY